MITKKSNFYRLLGLVISLLYVVTSLVFAIVLTGCDDKGGLTAPNSPFAGFVVDVTEAARAFTTTTTNTSTNHQMGHENLSYLWEVQGQHNTNTEQPQHTFTYADLGLIAPGDEALREFKLTVTEGNDASRRDIAEKTILFMRTVADVAAAAAVTFVGGECPDCRLYLGRGGRYGTWYTVDRVLMGWIE